jgi:hypothetical protein
MIEMINGKRGILNFVVALLSSLLYPLFLTFNLLRFLDPNNVVFDIQMIISNGILFIIVYTSFGLLEKDTLLHLFIGIAYIFLLLYFFTIGNNLFTLFLPHLRFGMLYYIFPDSTFIALDYTFMIILFLCLKSLNLLRQFLEPTKKDTIFNVAELKEITKKPKDSHFFQIS